MLLRDGAERIFPVLNKGDDNSSLLLLILSRSERKHQKQLAVKVVVDRINESLHGVLVCPFASSDVRGVGGGADTR